MEYVQSLVEDQSGQTVADCAVFTAIFRSPLFGGGGWSENSEYCWSFYFARTEKGGSWQLLTYGVP